ncbi:hypothetical protein Efla_003123 [Eimeria flavescens]
MRLLLLPPAAVGLLLPALVWAANDAPLPSILADQFGDIRSDLPSDTVHPPPKAPPPTEVTRVFVTREDGEGGNTGRGSSAPRRSRTTVDSATGGGSTVSGAAKERAVRFVAMSLFAVAFLGVVLTLLAEFDRKFSNMDSFFPPSMPPQEVPLVVADLIEKNKVVAFVADDCLICLDGLQSLRRQLKKPQRQVALLVSGHRLEWVIREYLERNYSIYRLPAIFIDGEPYNDFASAIEEFLMEEQYFCQRAIRVSTAHPVVEFHPPRRLYLKEEESSWKKSDLDGKDDGFSLEKT